MQRGTALYVTVSAIESGLQLRQFLGLSAVDSVVGVASPACGLVELEVRLGLGERIGRADWAAGAVRLTYSIQAGRPGCLCNRAAGGKMGFSQV